MADHVVYAVADGIGRLTLDRPGKKNAIDQPMYAALAGHLRAAEADSAVGALLIDATGDAFTAGTDLVDFQADGLDWHTAPVSRFLYALAEAEKPIVAAVGGLAVGIGTTMLLHCDLVVASATARFHLPFIDLGLVPEGASSLLLPRLVGHQRAAALLLLGEPFDAEAALAFGLVNRVVPPEVLPGAALDLARRLATKPPEAMRRSKRLMRRPAEDVVDRLTVEGETFAALLPSAEAKRAFADFFASRGRGR